MMIRCGFDEDGGEGTVEAVKQRIEVGGEGITLTLTVEPSTSMYGKEMRPGATTVSQLPWDEVAKVVLSADEGGLTLTVDATYGEFFEMREETEGFGEAVAALAGMTGVEVPSPVEGHVTLWEAGNQNRS